ncbi:MAG: histidine ammonia-lyase [Gammaproteobacteria bacterium]|nr:histidine ammonia-lyase [Gammaproteobacteria bacterium]
MSTRISAHASELSLAQLRDIWQGPAHMSLDEATLARVRSSQQAVSAAVAAEQPVYGINTGFGMLANVRIPDDHLVELQENLILSHCAGIGENLDDRSVRLTLVLKILSLAQGYSGVTPQLIVALSKLLNHEVYPCIPSRGSVGASGDLAPLAHLSAVLLGVGRARHAGREHDAREALTLAGLRPLTLQPKEGLALLNGTQVSTALALGGLFQAEKVFAAACLAGALSVDAASGSDTPFDARVSQVRGHQAQIDVARVIRELIAGSQIRASHRQCERVQDPYSLRCQPQVMGACLQAIRHVAGILLVEARAVTDNPLVFSDDGAILSGGNFHAEPVALACDYLAIAIAEIGALSERRIALLIDTRMSGLPPFLVEHSGLNSGFMVPQVTAVALASENKSLAHPASVDSLPTSANQEDHVSMATTAALRLQRMTENAAGIVAIELLAAAQGVEFHRPQRSSPPLEAVLASVRAVSARFERDRPLSGDIQTLQKMILDGQFVGPVTTILPSGTR